MEGSTMKLIFEPDNHSYVNADEPEKKWISVTTLIESYSKKEDFDKIAEKVSKSKKSKWYGIPKEEILKAWDDENKRSTDLGTWYHELREMEMLGKGFVKIGDVEVPVIKSPEENGKKIAPAQALTNGLYPEHMVYLNSAGICGQSDVVEVVDGVVNIKDYKTNKKIDRYSFVSWDGTSKKMLPPLQHMDDCNLSHYALQLSMYMYIILKHNPQLKPGSLTIIHVTFESDGENKYGYPIYKKDKNGNFIVKEITEYECDYLKKEIQSIVNLRR